MVLLEFFFLINPSGRIMALCSTKLVEDISTRNIYWGTGGRYLRLIILSHSRANFLEILEIQNPGTARTVSLRLMCLTFVYFPSTFSMSL